MKRIFGSAEHLVRVLLLFAAGLVAFLGLQQLLVPEGFGLYGHYRAGALDDNRARPAAFAGRAACADCHEAEPAALGRGKHAAVGCEACHGALARHAQAPDELTPVRPDPAALCLRCHARASGRSASFPQIDPADHAGEARCTECHSPHDPGSAP
ncbi:MAG TPA: cytochrome c3 family protein [Vicinamibacteria bacterium]|nr:cytochrome c3 family protein [Vicinamibacteria bacterium]